MSSKHANNLERSFYRWKPRKRSCHEVTTYCFLAFIKLDTDRSYMSTVQTRYNVLADPKLSMNLLHNVMIIKYLLVTVLTLAIVIIVWIPNTVSVGFCFYVLLKRG